MFRSRPRPRRNVGAWAIPTMALGVACGGSPSPLGRDGGAIVRAALPTATPTATGAPGAMGTAPTPLASPSPTASTEDQHARILAVATPFAAALKQAESECTFILVQGTSEECSPALNHLGRALTGFTADLASIHVSPDDLVYDDLAAVSSDLADVQAAMGALHRLLPQVSDATRRAQNRFLDDADTLDGALGTVIEAVKPHPDDEGASAPPVT